MRMPCCDEVQLPWILFRLLLVTNGDIHPSSMLENLTRLSCLW